MQIFIFDAKKKKLIGVIDNGSLRLFNLRLDLIKFIYCEKTRIYHTELIFTIYLFINNCIPTCFMDNLIKYNCKNLLNHVVYVNSIRSKNCKSTQCQ